MPDADAVRTAYYLLAILGLLASGAWWYVRLQRDRIAKLHTRIDQLERVMVTAEGLEAAIERVMDRCDERMRAHLEVDRQWRENHLREEREWKEQHREWGLAVIKNLEDMTKSVKEAVTDLSRRFESCRLDMIRHVDPKGDRR